jgi:hypothetical protein
MCYWDDPDDIPLNYKKILKRIEKFLKNINNSKKAVFKIKEKLKC